MSNSRSSHMVGVIQSPSRNLEHSVQFYQNLDSLISLIQSFVSKGDVGIIITRKALHKKLEKGFARNIIYIDAEELLETFMVDGLPHPILFERTMNKMFKPLAHHDNVYVFGEMVSLLWNDNNSAGAIVLEEMWNELQKKYSFSLLCAYPHKESLNELEAKRFSYMCSCHTSVRFNTAAPIES